jgi:hypothetical protein
MAYIDAVVCGGLKRKRERKREKERERERKRERKREKGPPNLRGHQSKLTTKRIQRSR